VSGNDFQQNPYAPQNIGREVAARSSPPSLAGPAISLLVVGGFSILCLLAALAFDIFLVASGVIDSLPNDGPMSERTQLTVRAAWSVLLLISNIVTIIGAIGMLRYRKRFMALTACILSVIPCLGPCFVLGLPFGVWGLVLLNKPEVRDSFT
jgi:hypothetical protein